ncbi:hypothetical protein G6F31_018882 [Rhizopus arrhizus]|nr:hypothetical protein G6F31_018882 [Rhizopus arrhizus]
MDDQDMTSLPDAINNTAGMVGVQGVGPGVAINARGFPPGQLGAGFAGVLRPRGTPARGGGPAARGGQPGRRDQPGAQAWRGGAVGGHHRQGRVVGPLWPAAGRGRPLERGGHLARPRGGG